MHNDDGDDKQSKGKGGILPSEPDPPNMLSAFAKTSLAPLPASPTAKLVSTDQTF